MGLGLFNQGRHRVHRAKHVGNVGDCQHPGLLIEQAGEGLEVQLAFRCHLNRHHFRTRALGNHLPGHDVGVVFHVAHQDLVTSLQARGEPIGN